MRQTSAAYRQTSSSTALSPSRRRALGRAGERAVTLTLAELRDNEDVDMFTTVFVGNEQTKLLDGKMVTPRGYLQREG